VSLHTWCPRFPATQVAVTPSHPTHTWAELPQAKKCLASMHPGHFCHVQLFETMWTVACQVYLSRGFSRQYWSVLANTGCHTLLEHYISYCPSCHLPWVPGGARTPAPQAAARPSNLALTGADPSPPGQSQEQIPVDNPHAEVEIKPQLQPRCSMAKEEDQNLPTSYTSCRLNPQDQPDRLCVYGIYKRTLRAPTKANTLVMTAVDIGDKNTQE